MKKYEDTVLIKLRRDYSKDEVVMFALNKIKELQIEKGKNKSYIDELESEIEKVKKENAILKLPKKKEKITDEEKLNYENQIKALNGSLTKSQTELKQILAQPDFYKSKQLRNTLEVLEKRVFKLIAGNNLLSLENGFLNKKITNFLNPDELQKFHIELNILKYTKKIKEIMKEFKGTKGEFSFSPQKGTKGHCLQAQIWSSVQETSVVNIKSTETEEEANSNAKLITDALNTINICGLHPSELLEKHNELIKLLKKAKFTISRLKNSLMEHPDCKEHSEFADYVELAEQQEYEIELLIK